MLDYLAAIYLLAQDSEKVTTTALADKMCVSAAAASSMLKRLQDSGFVERSNMDGTTLTEQGTLAALQLIRRHRLLEVFLIDVMGYTWDQVELEAHKLEHAISGAFEQRMDELCGYPTHCPHGDPIPRPDGRLPDEDLLSVVALKPGQTGMLRRVRTHEPSVLRYLSQLMLVPGSHVRLVEQAPFNGPVTLELLGTANGHDKGAVSDEDATNQVQVLGSALAELLYVVPQASLKVPSSPQEKVADGKIAQNGAQESSTAVGATLSEHR